MSWDDRIDAVWADDTLTDAQRIERIDALAAERPEDDARALFQSAGARDSAGEEVAAEVLYRAALEAGLSENEHAQAVIQLGSTLRNLGKLDEATALLAAERDRGGELSDAASAFLALALIDAGDPRRAALVAIDALAPHLPRYTRSVRAYVQERADPPR
ncbi:MAG: tetratricopeptide repeat protein [Actinomycetota bacterium]